MQTVKMSINKYFNQIYMSKDQVQCNQIHTRNINIYTLIASTYIYKTYNKLHNINRSYIN